MAYVAPNGTIQLFRSVELTPAYTDTIWFPNISTQDTVFTAQVDYQFTNQMYTRVSGNKVRVHIVADEIRDCSYMRFQNIRNNKAKWFYAFIMNVEYVNEQVSEITYEIDEIQSWYFESNSNNHFAKCFIERQHSVTDSAGDNLQPEPLHPETYVANGDIVEEGNMVIKTASAQNVGYIVAIGAFTFPTTSGSSIFTTAQYSGLATSIKYLYFDSPNQLFTFLNVLDVVEGGIKGLFKTDDLWDLLGIYVVPEPETIYDDPFFQLEGTNIPMLAGGNVKQLSKWTYTNEITPSTGLPKPQGFGEGITRYYPKNNKLFTYPYTYLRVQTPTKEMDFRYELFMGQRPRFGYVSGCNPEPYFFIYPLYYKQDSIPTDYSLLLDDFPKIPTYQSGLMNSLGQKIGGTISAAAKIGLGMAVGGAVGIAGGSGAATISPVGSGSTSIGQSVLGTAVSAIKQEMPTMHEIGDITRPGEMTSLLPSLVPKNNGDLGPLPISASDFKIVIQPWSILPESAMKFDRFLSMYGYAQNNVDTPNVHARTKWTYVKTRNCRCTVNAPASSLAKINSIMDSGITWWDYRTSVGAYGDFTNPIA